MANPRQRRKQRSGHKPVKHSGRARRKLKKMPVLHAPKVLRDAWDPKLTVKQNYARLGLLPTLNPRAKGGSEGIMRRRTTMVDIEQPQDSGMATKEVLPIGHGRIIRDAAGNIVDIQLCDSGDSSKEMGEDKDMLDEETQQVQANVVSSEREKWIQRTSNTGNTELIHDLEKLATQVVKVPRTASSGEKAWLAEVVAVYGADYDAAVRDRKLNPWQRTAGEIKRSIAKAGGLAGLSRRR